MAIIRVCVLDEHEIFRRGILACLREDPSIIIEADPEDGGAPDLAVVSHALAASRQLPCPVLICANDLTLTAVSTPNHVLGTLSRAQLTPERLLGAVHAAAVGLEISVSATTPADGFGTRGIAVLRLLAAGHQTEDIARQLGCSDRTIKLDVAALCRSLGARNRTHAVAEGVRLGII